MVEGSRYPCWLVFSPVNGSWLSDKPTTKGRVYAHARWVVAVLCLGFWLMILHTSRPQSVPSFPIF